MGTFRVRRSARRLLVAATIAASGTLVACTGSVEVPTFASGPVATPAQAGRMDLPAREWAAAAVAGATDEPTTDDLIAAPRSARDSVLVAAGPPSVSMIMAAQRPYAGQVRDRLESTPSTADGRRGPGARLRSAGAPATQRADLVARCGPTEDRQESRC